MSDHFPSVSPSKQPLTDHYWFQSNKLATTKKDYLCSQQYSEYSIQDLGIAGNDQKHEGRIFTSLAGQH